MKRLTSLSEKKKVAAVVTESGVPSLNRYRPKIVVTREKLNAAKEEDVGNAGEFSSSVHSFLKSESLKRAAVSTSPRFCKRRKTHKT
jgi:hypothetical protein